MFALSFLKGLDAMRLLAKPSFYKAVRENNFLDFCISMGYNTFVHGAPLAGA